MEALSVVLNAYNLKRLVVVPQEHGAGECSVQIWKGDELCDVFEYSDIEFFLTMKKHVIRRISCFLKGNRPDMAGSWFTTLNHTITFLELRDKPFVSIERDDRLQEINGMPHFKQCYFGCTAWNELCKNRKEIVMTLLSHHYPKQDCTEFPLYDAMMFD